MTPSLLALVKLHPVIRDSPLLVGAHDVSAPPSMSTQIVISTTVCTPVTISRWTLKTRILSLPHRADERWGMAIEFRVGKLIIGWQKSLESLWGGTLHGGSLSTSLIPCPQSPHRRTPKSVMNDGFFSHVIIAARDHMRA